MSKKIILMVASILLTVACHEKQQLTEMHDSTQDMRDTTKKMNDTTTDLKDSTKELLDTSKDMSNKMDTMSDLTTQVLNRSDELYDASRQGLSLQLRREAIDSLIKAQSFGKKISEAAKYFSSFEFQLFEGVGKDQLDSKRQLLLRDAMAEFFKDIDELSTSSDESDPLANTILKTQSGNLDASFNAISVTTHILNRKQEEMLAKFPNFQPITVYSIIEEGLKLEEKLNTGKVSINEIPMYLQEVLNNKKIAIRLLQARHNFAEVVFLSNITDIKNSKLTAGAMYMMGWDFKIDDFNLSQIVEFTKFINASIKTKKLLQDIGIKPVESKIVSNWFKNMKIVSSGDGAAKIVSARMELMAVLQELAASLYHFEK